MEFIIVRTTTTRLSETEEVLSTSSGETYLLVPAEGKALRHKQTKQIFRTGVSLNCRTKRDLFEEIVDPSVGSELPN